MWKSRLTCGIQMWETTEECGSIQFTASGGGLDPETMLTVISRNITILGEEIRFQMAWGSCASEAPMHIFCGQTMPSRRRKLGDVCAA